MGTGCLTGDFYRNMDKRYYIGIDPDVDDGSGVAVLDKRTRDIEVMNLSLPEILDFFRTDPRISDSFTVIEKSSYTSHNWHRSGTDRFQANSKIGYNIARNHQLQTDIFEILSHMGVEIVEKAPLALIWKKGKISHEEITRITGWKRKKSNQEQRDALLLAWDVSGLPIKC